MKAIDELNNIPKENNYAKILPVTQSSGTGKSKTVDEVAKERILFPLCLREDIGLEYFGEENLYTFFESHSIWQIAYPPTDTEVREYLLHPQSASKADCMEHFKVFFIALFIEAHELATELFSESSRTSYSRMADRFYKFFEEERMSFYQAVVARARKLPKRDPEAGASEPSYQDLKEPFRRFSDHLEACCSDWPPVSSFCPILMSIDEVHVMYSKRPQDADGSYSLYERIKSVISYMVTERFCVIVLSTATNVMKLAPSRDVAPSIRERDSERQLPVPFMELQFDAHIIADPLAPGKEKLASVGSLEFCAKFGRPMYVCCWSSTSCFLT